MWSMAVAGLAFGSLAMLGGTAVGGELGPLVVGYGLLMALAVRERVWQRLSAPRLESPAGDRLAGRRVF